MDPIGSTGECSVTKAQQRRGGKAEIYSGNITMVKRCSPFGLWATLNRRISRTNRVYNAEEALKLDRLFRSAFGEKPYWVIEVVKELRSNYG